ncbi:MAG: alpha/beta fold hydrolase [Gemmatimonadales bacterium]|nr:alpha/beta fold hydrolase [Gemmatimonadales bacterium]
MPTPPIDLTVYPDECDAYGHLNQASFLTLFERARWETMARGPGMDVFQRSGAWPAVRKTTIDYHLGAYPGDVLRFEQLLVHFGRTSFTLRQVARRTRDDALIATAEFVFVCIDKAGKPMPVPAEIQRFLNAEPEGERLRRFTVNGVRLAVAERGVGLPVLFIHGFPLDHTIWAHQVETLDGFRRIAPDLRGFGGSDAPDLGYGMATYADDLAALLDALHVDAAVLCGVSMGGYIAFEFARRHRQRVKGLVLMDTRAEADTPEARRGREHAIQVAREKGTGALALQLLPRMLRPDAATAAPEVAEGTRAMMASAPVQGVVGALVAMRERADSTPTLATLAGVPTLVVVGEQDQLTPPALARAIADGIPDASLAVIPGAGHLPMLEQPQATTDALRRFLLGVRG